MASLRGDLFDHGEEVVEEAVPGFDFAETRALKLGVRGVVGDDGAEAVEMTVGVFEVRFDAEAQETVGKTAEIEFGLEMLLAHARQEDALDGAELTKPFDSFECAAAAGAQQGHYFVEVERARRGKKEAVDLADGTRQGKGAGGADEKRDGLLLEGSQGGEVRGLGCRATWVGAGFAGRLPPLVKTRGLAGRGWHFPRCGPGPRGNN